MGAGSCMIALPVVDLPQPDSPTSPSVSPGFTSRLMFVDGVDLQPGVPHRELDHEVLHPKQRVFGWAQMRGAGTGHQATTEEVGVAGASPPFTGIPAALTPAATLAASAALPASGTDREEATIRVTRGIAFAETGLFLEAPGLRVRAARRELAAGRRVHEIRRAADDRLEPRVARLRQLRDRLEQGLGVRIGASR